MAQQVVRRSALIDATTIKTAAVIDMPEVRQRVSQRHHAAEVGDVFIRDYLALSAAAEGVGELDAIRNVINQKPGVKTYRFLRLARPTEEEMADGAAFPPGSVHLPTWVESEWLKQVVAEQLVTVRTRRGFAKLEWQKLRERNEALDCRVYARAAAWIAGADRWPDEKWRDLEDQLGAAPTDTDPAGQINRPGQAPQGKRRSDWLGRRGGWF